MNLADLQDFLKGLTNFTDSQLYISIVKRLKRKTFSGYGIVKNVDATEAEALLHVAHFKFNGIWLAIKPFLKNKSTINMLRHDRTEKKIYLRGMSEKLDEGDLENYFMKFGEVLHVQIGKHQYTNIYKGFGFIEYSWPESVKAVLKQKIHTIRGVQIECERSKVNSASQQRPAQDQSRDPYSHDQSRSRVCDSDESKKHNKRERYIDCGTVADHFKPFTHAVDRVAWNHTKNNLVFRIPASSQ